MVTPAPGTPQSGSFWLTLKAVAWALLGIRKREGYESDLQKINPVHLLVVGLVAVLLLVVGLMLLVRWVVAT
jgi:hypothetical protein